MAVGLKEPQRLLPIKGIKTSAIAAGIKKSASQDLVLFELAEASRCAAVFTRNLFCAAPVTLAKLHLSKQAPRYLLINSGNANAGTGDQGMHDAIQCCQIVAEQAGCTAAEVLPFSTGVIGENLPVNKFSAAMPELVAALDDDAWMQAGRGIMTTDTLMKGVSKQIELDDKTITITGIAKGSGMIRPDMATMLSYIGTDLAIAHALLQQCLERAVQQSFNAITVDGDTSTNDACVLVATGQAGNSEISEEDADYRLFEHALVEVCEFLAQAIIRDGEGATKFITLEVVNAASNQNARDIAYTVAHSPLVKTALFASDPNWGRILAAVGRSGVDLDLDRVEIFLGEVCIVNQGGRAASYTEAQGQAVMSGDEITLRIDLHAGNNSARVWTCDLSYDYVRINAEYRS
ncbi:MAG: bifunctional glutamate N-acetyltransferase/amino-acid acetyltransferase ArgJ [Gammaproteobacteria bacterium]